MSVGIDTSAAGSRSGTAVISLESDGAGTSNIAGNMVLTSQTVTVSGDVYRLAQASAAAPNPVDFGNVRLNDTAQQVLNLQNTAASDGYSENLNAGFAAPSSTDITASGSISGLAAQASNNTDLVVGIDTSSAGTKSGTVGLNLESDGDGINSLGQTALTGQTISISGDVFRLAQAGITPDPVQLYARTGDTTEQILTISNTAVADTFSEGLRAELASTAGDAGMNGTTTSVIAAGSSDSSSLAMTMDTSTSGIKAGTATLNLISDGTGTSGLADYDLGTQTIALNGKVYQEAAASISPDPVDFGIVHKGDVVTAQNVAVKNTATGDLVDVVTGGFKTVTGPFSGTGSLSGVLSNSTDSTSLLMSMNTANTGIFSGTASFELFSHNDDMADLALAEQQITVQAQVNDYADPAFQMVSGDGTLSGGGFSWELGLGTIDLGTGSLEASLNIKNDVLGLADTLGGALDTSLLAAFAANGLTTFTGIEAGDTTGLFTLSLSGATAGFFDETLILRAYGYNDSGYNADFQDIILRITGTVNDPGQQGPVPEPGTFLLFGIGLLALTRQSRKKQTL